MDDLSKVTPMRPLRDVLREFESLMDSEAEDAPKDEPCMRRNGTGTELVKDGNLVRARACKHGDSE